MSDLCHAAPTPMVLSDHSVPRHAIDRLQMTMRRNLKRVGGAFPRLKMGAPST